MKSEKNIIIGLFGKPASGKSRLAEALQKQLTEWFGLPPEDIFVFSVGELLREEAKNGTALGLRYADLLARDLLLPQGEIDPFVLEYVRAHPSPITIIDGHPRCKESVEFMTKNMSDYSLAFVKSTIPDHVAIQRLSEMNKTGETIDRRMAEYHEMSVKAWNEIAANAPENHYVVDGQKDFDWNVRRLLRHILINQSLFRK